MVGRKIGAVLWILFLLSRPWVLGAAETGDTVCPRDPDSKLYHCVSGPLEGQDFVDEGAIRRALDEATNAAREPEPPVESDTLRLISWDAKTWNQQTDYDRVARILANSDLVVIQNMKTEVEADGPMNRLSHFLEHRWGEKVCTAWSQAKERRSAGHAFLWRERRLVLIGKSGEVPESCAGHSVQIPTEKTGPMKAHFLFKPLSQLFLVESMAPTTGFKFSATEVKSVLKLLADSQWPAILAGDLGLAGLTTSNVKLALPKSKTRRAKGTTDLANLWTKNLSVLSISPINFVTEIPEVDEKDLRSTLGEIAPLIAEIALRPVDVSEVQLKLMAKKKPPMAHPAKSEPPSAD